MRGRNSSDSGKRPYLAPGQYRVYCDLSGFPCSQDEIRRTWDGFLVRKDFWYPRQPQDFPLTTRGVTSVINARPLNEYAVAGATQNHVAGVNDGNFLVFQDGSYIGFKYYPDEYVGNE